MVVGGVGCLDAPTELLVGCCCVFRPWTWELRDLFIQSNSLFSFDVVMIGLKGTLNVRPTYI